MMQGYGPMMPMMWGMGLLWLLVVVVLILGAAALLKYLLSGRRRGDRNGEDFAAASSTDPSRKGTVMTIISRRHLVAGLALGAALVRSPRHRPPRTSRPSACTL